MTYSMWQDYSVTKTKQKNLWQILKNYLKPSRQTVERMHLHRSGSFVSVVCSGITALRCSVVVHSAVLSCTCWCSWHLKHTLSNFKSSRQTAEWMYLHRSGSFVSVVCSGITVFQCSVVVHSAVLSCACWCSWHLRTHIKTINRNIKTKSPKTSRF